MQQQYIDHDSNNNNSEIEVTLEDSHLLMRSC